MAKSLLTFCCFVVFGLLPICGFSQKKENTQKIEDTIISNDKILDTSVSSVIHYLELYTETLNKANAMLKRGFDTSAIADNQPENERVVNLIHELAPKAKICFNTNPMDTVASVQRWV